MPLERKTNIKRTYPICSAISKSYSLLSRTKAQEMRIIKWNSADVWVFSLLLTNHPITDTCGEAQKPLAAEVENEVFFAAHTFVLLLLKRITIGFHIQPRPSPQPAVLARRAREIILHPNNIDVLRWGWAERGMCEWERELGPGAMLFATRHIISRRRNDCAPALAKTAIFANFCHIMRDTTKGQNHNIINKNVALGALVLFFYLVNKQHDGVIFCKVMTLQLLFIFMLKCTLHKLIFFMICL